MYQEQQHFRNWVVQLHYTASIPYSFLAQKMGMSGSALRMFVAGERNLSDDRFLIAKQNMKLFRNELLEIL